MSLIYATSTILLVLKIFPFEPGLLPGSLSHKSCYGHYADVRENVSGYRLGLTVFVLYENYDVCFYSYWF